MQHVQQRPDLPQRSTWFIEETEAEEVLYSRYQFNEAWTLDVNATVVVLSSFHDIHKDAVDLESHHYFVVLEGDLGTVADGCQATFTAKLAVSLVDKQQNDDDEDGLEG